MKFIVLILLWVAALAGAGCRGNTSSSPTAALPITVGMTWSEVDRALGVREGRYVVVAVIPVGPDGKLLPPPQVPVGDDQVISLAPRRGLFQRGRGPEVAVHMQKNQVVAVAPDIAGLRSAK